MNAKKQTGGTRLPFFILTLAFWCATAFGQSTTRPALSAPGSPASKPPGNTPEPTEVAQNPSLEQLLRAILIEAVSDIYTDESRWNRDAERFDGFRIEGLKLIPRTKRVEHGFWQRYTASFLHPEETFKIVVQPLEQPVDGQSAFDVTLMVKARIEADFAHWTYGVKGFNGSMISDATIHARLRLLVAPQVRLDWNKLVPDVGLAVTVAEIDMRLRDLNVHRIGLIDGWLARQIGDGSRKAVEVLIQRQSKRIIERLQSRLDKLHVDR